jgi:hypothetical protein
MLGLSPGEIDMSEVTYPHILKELGLPARMASHPRTRVAMIVMEYLGRGVAVEDVLWQFPFLTLAEVHAAMAYYYDHQFEIDVEIQGEREQLKIRPDAGSQSKNFH